MVLCIIGLAVFGILGIFSARYRRLAKESLKCVFRMATFRPCESTIDQQARAHSASMLMGISPAIAKFVYKHFSILSWLMVLLIISSSAAIGWGVYNYVSFGNCNGPESTGFCPFSGIQNVQAISINDVSLENRPVRGKESAEVNIIEFACLQCPYSKQAEPAVRQVLDAYPDKAKLTFIFFPLPQHNNGQLAAQAALCAQQQGKFWEFHDELFEKQDEINNSVNDEQAEENIKLIASNLGIEMAYFNECVGSSEIREQVKNDYESAVKLGLKGTPTFFINDEKLTGPQQFSTFKKIIDKTSSSR